MMHPLAALLVTSLVGLSQAIAPPPFDPCKPYCADVFMVACRATLEVAGEGQIGAVAQYVQDNTQQTVERLALEYPALLEGYPESAAVGASRLKEILRKHTDACPEQKIVLLGYSQGAQVVGDAIAGGGGGEMGPITAGMEQNLIDRITAVVLMGDPRHMATEEYQYGTATEKSGNGVFPRTPEQMAVLNGIKDKISSYCNAKDALCAVKGKGSLGGHYNTIEMFTIQAQNWVLEMIDSPAAKRIQDELPFPDDEPL